MPTIPQFRAGELYPSKSWVRRHFREFWKGILVCDERLAIIQAYKGLARRHHYEDSLDPVSMTLRYVGEGLANDQSLTRGNRALVEAAQSKLPVDVFFDCGDIQLPSECERGHEKHLVAGGKWLVVAADYKFLKEHDRKVWLFQLNPADEQTRKTVQSIFLDSAAPDFERVLNRFARIRSEMYEAYSHILRAHDSIAGFVGEYFAVQRFNAAHRQKPLVRVRSNFRDLDAIQTGTGHRFAIKTLTSSKQRTSNIWTPYERLVECLDSFLLLELSQEDLCPRGLYRLPVEQARPFWARDSRQRCGKLCFDQPLRDAAERIV